MQTTVIETRNSFLAIAIQHTNAANSGDDVTANALHQKLMNELEEWNDSQRRLILEPLLQHSEIAVKLWASSGLLGIEDKKAVAVLKAIRNDKSSGLLAFIAEALLDFWENGYFKRT